MKGISAHLFVLQKEAKSNSLKRQCGVTTAVLPLWKKITSLYVCSKLFDNGGKRLLFKN